MHPAPSFITPVNAAGLPIAWSTQPATGTETLTHVTATDIAQLYWRLHSIQADFSYSIGPQHFSYCVTAYTTALPHERILGPATCETFIQHTVSVSTYLAINLSDINHHPDGTFCLSLQLSHQDAFPNYSLTSTVPDLMDPSYTLTSKATIDFMGYPFILYGQYLSGHSESLKVHQCKLTPIWYQF